MIKEQADKIADNILKDFYIEREKEAFTRSEFKSWFSSKISAALVDASKHDNACAEFETFEQWQESLDSDQYQTWRDNETLIEQAYLAGQKSTPRRQPSLKLPSDEPQWPFDPPICNMGFTEYGKGNYEGFLEAKNRCKLAFKLWIEKIKSLNEGK